MVHVLSIHLKCTCILFFLGFATDRTQAYNFAKYEKLKKDRNGKINKKRKETLFRMQKHILLNIKNLPSSRFFVFLGNSLLHYFDRNFAKECNIHRFSNRCYQFSFFMNFYTFGRLKCAKSAKFRAPKVSKMAVLELLNSTNIKQLFVYNSFPFCSKM